MQLDTQAGSVFWAITNWLARAADRKTSLILAANMTLRGWKKKVILNNNKKKKKKNIK